MKKTIILICISIALNNAIAQNPPVVEKAAPRSNNLLPSNGTLGSNSGVNPAGNPGTIINYSANSNAINSRVTPNPNVEKGVFLNSSPEGTVITTTVTNGADVQTATTSVVNGSAVTTREQEVKPIQDVTPHGAPPPNPTPAIDTKSSIPPTPPVATTGMKTKVEENSKGLPAYSPVRGNFIPEEVIKKIKSKYGGTVYDIKTVRVVKSNKIAYLIRVYENGNFRNEMFYDEP